MSFSTACDGLSTAARLLVVNQLTAWRDEESWEQVVQNIENETALPTAVFTSLLNAFGQQLASGEAAPQAWLSACRQGCHQFRGAALPPTICPSVVGRAMKITNYANLIATEPSAGLTEDQATTLLLRFAARPLPLRVRRTLQRAPLGRYDIWSTFNAAAPTQDPFESLSQSTIDILTALGLGDFAATETLVLLAYRPLNGGVPEPLYRPTIAEAGDSRFFQPYSDAAHPYGYTAPLPPNPSGIAGQPEIIHRPIIAEGLLVPFRLSTPAGTSHGNP